MTYAEDRVLVGVINRKRDLETARHKGWYRIPVARLARGVNAEYIGFFLSGAFKELNGAVHYYAECKGIELAYRRWLLPDEPDHPRADEQYYKIALGDLIPKTPPIVNTTKRSIAFVSTTWDRFIHARTIPDLYSKADYFVDRIYHALRATGMQPERFWEVESSVIHHAPGLEIMTAEGPLYLSTKPTENALYLDLELSQDVLLRTIREELAKRGGPVDLNVPLDGF